jgi:hypothetical protein
MKTDKVKELQELTTGLAGMIVDMVPETAADWDAMEKMQAAHKQLRGIDITELFEKPPRAGYTK